MDGENNGKTLLKTIFGNIHIHIAWIGILSYCIYCNSCLFPFSFRCEEECDHEHLESSGVQNSKQNAASKKKFIAWNSCQKQIPQCFMGFLLSNLFIIWNACLEVGFRVTFFKKNIMPRVSNLTWCFSPSSLKRNDFKSYTPEDEQRIWKWWFGRWFSRGVFSGSISSILIFRGVTMFFWRIILKFDVFVAGAVLLQSGVRIL